MAASKQASIHTPVRNAVTLVWGLLRLAPINYIHQMEQHLPFELTPYGVCNYYMHHLTVQ